MIFGDSGWLEQPTMWVAAEVQTRSAAQASQSGSAVDQTQAAKLEGQTPRSPMGQRPEEHSRVS